MIRLFSVLVLGVAIAAYSSPSIAADKDKEVKLEGNVVCGKCELKESAKCAVAIVAKDKDGKNVTYWFDEKASKKYHGDVCQEVKKGSVTGTVEKNKDGKLIITVADLKYAK